MEKCWKEDILAILEADYHTTIYEANMVEMYNAISKSTMKSLYSDWKREDFGKKVCYLSAEFLVGKFIFQNLFNLGLMKEFTELMEEKKVDISFFEELEDAALGNGGLGRLAACFLDSGASLGILINGYGIRYRYGLFKQYFEKGFQKEKEDDWQNFGDPWSVRREEDKVKIDFKNCSVYAVPYDYPVIGYHNKKINTLRLWQSEPINKFDFKIFNNQKYAGAFKCQVEAESISCILYPNENNDKGKRLRLKQEYFFSAATMADLVRTYKKKYGDDFTYFSSEYAIQLNDTHPVVAIPELIRLLMESEKMSLEDAIKIGKESFAYTNHTVMSEALEKWSVTLFQSVIPKVYSCILLIQQKLLEELTNMGMKTYNMQKEYLIVDNDVIHMARLAIYVCHSINGVASIHTDILKQDLLKEWFAIYPNRFNNKTNGISQRRWLAICNEELTELVSSKIGQGWITNLEMLKELERYSEDKEIINEFGKIKLRKKTQLAEFVYKQEKIEIDPKFIFDIHVKRIHEYKRQLLNAFSILDIYFGIKEGRIKEFHPMVFFFGGKAAPGYYRAKGIIKYINEIAKLISSDNEVNNKMQVVFLPNYNVSYSEKLIPAADISEQISTAGTEASGTGNMKFMLNGAVTLGTYDGANIEIVEQAGEENNYVFGARVEELRSITQTYQPREIYESHSRIKKVLDTLIDGTFDDDNTGMFQELYHSILDGASWHRADHYFLLYDFIAYNEARLKANEDYSNTYEFHRKCFLNMVNAGKFSSDRAIKEYARDIWSV